MKPAEVTVKSIKSQLRDLFENAGLHKWELKDDSSDGYSVEIKYDGRVIYSHKSHDEQVPWLNAMDMFKESTKAQLRLQLLKEFWTERFTEHHNVTNALNDLAHDGYVLFSMEKEGSMMRILAHVAGYEGTLLSKGLVRNAG